MRQTQFPARTSVQCRTWEAQRPGDLLHPDHCHRPCQKWHHLGDERSVIGGNWIYTVKINKSGKGTLKVTPLTDLDAADASADG